MAFDWFTRPNPLAPGAEPTPGFYDGHDAFTAAVGPLLNTKQSGWFGGGGSSVADKQKQVCAYDVNGPGFVGYYLDLYSSLASEIPLVMQNRTEGGPWERWDTGRANELLNSIHGADGTDPEEFHRLNCRRVEALGEFALWPHKDGPNGGWHTAAVHTIESVGKHPTIKGAPASYVVKTHPDADKNDPGRYVVPYAQMRRIWSPDALYPDLPYSPLFRILNDIRRFETFNRGIQRHSAALILMQGLLWFKGEASDISGKPDPTAPHDGARLGGLGLMIQSIMKAAQRNSNDVDEKLVAGAFPHPVVYPERPEHIDLGGGIPAGVLDGKQDALADSARGVSGPMSAIVEGQGAAQRLLNEWRQESAIVRSAAALSSKVAQGYTKAIINKRLNESEIGNVRVWIDPSAIETVETDPADDCMLWEKGLITRDELARRRNVDPTGILPLPDGVSDYEHWLTARVPNLAINPGGIPGLTDEAQAPPAQSPTGPDTPQTAALPWWKWD